MLLKTLVARRLKELGISQSELAVRADVNKVYVSELLSGRKKAVQARFLPRLAYALEIEPTAIMEAMERRQTRRSQRDNVSPDPEIEVTSKPAKFFLERGVPRRRRQGGGALPFIERFPSDFLSMNEKTLQATFKKISLAHMLSVGSYAFPRSAMARVPDIWDDPLYVAVRHLPIHQGQIFVAWCQFAPPDFTPILGRYDGEDEHYISVASLSNGSLHLIPLQSLRGAHRVVATLDGSAFR